MPDTQFFEESREQSQVKAEIVARYFSTWARIIIATQKKFPKREQRIGYVDLFAGPGRYKDGTISTPLRVLNKALEDDDIRQRLVTIFNDVDSDSIHSLESAIHELPNINSLTHRPIIRNEEVGDKIAEEFLNMRTIPILAFIDPWGYKGLSLRLVDAFLKDWGCDCIFFFNYSRINAGLNNPFVQTHMSALFGTERTSELGRTLAEMNPAEREATIINELAAALLEHDPSRLVLPFCFKKPDGSRTTHHLIFVTKHFKGYEIMKEIMARSSSDESQGVSSFEYSASTSSTQQLLFDFNRPFDELKAILLKDFAGQFLSLKEIYESHSIGRPYLLKHYRKALTELEKTGKIDTRGRKSKRGFPDYLVAIFPKDHP